MNKLIFGSLGVLVVFLRPSAVGEIYSLHVSAVISLILIVYAVVNSSDYRVSPPSLALAQLGLALVVVFQLAIQSAAAGGIFAMDAPKALAMSLVVLLALFLAVSKTDHARAFFSALCIVVLLACLSTLVTASLMASGIRWTSIVIGQNDQTHYGNLYILFPYTLSFNLAATPFGVMPRLSGIFREPGLLPAFACWAAAYAHLRRWPIILSFIALGGSVCSLSTFGVPLAAFTGSMIVLRRVGLGTWPALGVVVGVGLFMWPVLYALEHVGLSAKIRSQSGSFEARRDAIATALSASNLIIGDGPSMSYGRDATVNLIGKIRSIGIFGFVMTILAHILPFWKSIFVVGVVPIIVTIITAQPVAGDAAVLAICLSWTAFAKR